MREKLKEIIKNAYTPYYDYQVACAIEMNDGEIIYGVNIQLPTLSGTICAERNAINSAVTKGYKKENFEKLYLYSEQENPIFPCFICRQTILEFFDLEKKIITMNEKSEKEYFLKELIPYTFSGDDVK